MATFGFRAGITPGLSLREYNVNRSEIHAATVRPSWSINHVLCHC
jgi:hypothetical protein